MNIKEKIMFISGIILVILCLIVFINIDMNRTTTNPPLNTLEEAGFYVKELPNGLVCVMYSGYRTYGMSCDWDNWNKQIEG